MKDRLTHFLEQHWFELLAFSLIIAFLILEVRHQDSAISLTDCMALLGQ